jgi:hypothetical protein
MPLVDVVAAAAQALQLLAAYPWHWLAFTFIFLVVAEGLMFVPFIGFVSKLAVASLIAAQCFVLFQQASAGAPPILGSLLQVFALPPAAQACIILSALVPFVAGLFYLQRAAGWPAVKFFFGNILKAKPPEAKHFERFKYVMQFAAVPFTFVAPLVVLGGVHDPTSIVQGVVLGMKNWPVLLLLLAMSLAFEWSSAKLGKGLPKKLAIPVLGLSLVVNLLWAFAFSYSLYELVAPSPR